VGAAGFICVRRFLLYLAIIKPQHFIVRVFVSGNGQCGFFKFCVIVFVEEAYDLISECIFINDYDGFTLISFSYS
jgi:hypothetical protein